MRTRGGGGRARDLRQDPPNDRPSPVVLVVQHRLFDQREDQGPRQRPDLQHRCVGGQTWIDAGADIDGGLFDSATGNDRVSDAGGRIVGAVGGAGWWRDALSGAR